MVKKLLNILLSLIVTVVSFGTFTDYSVKAEINRNSIIRNENEIDCSSSNVWINTGSSGEPQNVCLNGNYYLYYEKDSSSGNNYVFSINLFEDDVEYILYLTSASAGKPAGIRVTGGSGTEADPFTFGVVFDVSEIKLPGTIQVAKGETKPLTPVLEPTDTFPEVTWTSSNTSVATVDEQGNVTGINNGTATITAVATNGTEDTSDDKTATCEVSVADIFGITLQPDRTSVTVDKSFAVTAITEPADRPVVWSAFNGESNGKVALYSNAECTNPVSAGISTVYVKGVNPGTATITASGAADSSVSASMTVIVYSKENVRVQSVTVAPESLVMNANSAGETLTATVFPAHATHPDIVWSSSDSDVATVSSDGVVTPVGEGTAIITATATNGPETTDDIRATCNVKVNPPAYRIAAAVSPESSGTVTTEPAEKAMEGDSVQLNAVPAEGYQFVNWDVKDENGETIEVSGNAFTMPALGVTVTAVFKKIETYNVWVKDIPVTSVNKDNVLGDTGDPTVVFNSENNTLTLNNANISGGATGIRANRGLTIKGSGTVQGTDHGVLIEGSVYNELIFNVEKINVTGKKSDGIIAPLIRINGGTVTAKTENNAACAIAGKTGLTYDDGFMEVIKPVNGDVSFHNYYYRVLDANGNIATEAVIGPKTSFDVTVGKTVNGTVIASTDKAKPEDTVTLTVIPDDGYKLTSLTVTDYDDNTVPTDPVEGDPAKYVFTMPALDVDVSASFEEIVKNYDLWVNGIRVNSENASDILKNNTAQFDAETNTLTLNGANITDVGEKKAGIYSALDSLIITGSNTSTIRIADKEKRAIHAEGNLTLNADITAAGDDYGIYSGKILTIAGGTITASGETGIYGYNKIEINGGTVSSTGTDGNGINTPNYLVISGGNVTAHGSDEGIYAVENITVEGGTITATGGSAAIGKTVKNSIPGTGWTDVEGSGIGKTIEANPKGQTLSYKKVMFPADSPVTEYNVTVFSTENGTVNADQTSASSGTTITLTVTPSEGYELESLTVTPSEGDSISPEKMADTTYTFVMPESDVTVTAAFRKLPEPGKIDVTGITVTPSTLSLDLQDSGNLTAAVEPENASDKTVTWTSSNPVIATVNNKGVVTAMADGTVTITATATNGTADTSDDKTATCEVTVINLLDRFVASWTDPSTGMTYYTQDMASALGSWRSDGGTLTLLKNINYEGITINNFQDNKILDLNGHQLTLSNGLNIKGGTLTLKDSQNKGVVTSPSENGTVNVTGGRFIMQGGTITSTYAADGNNAGTGVSISSGSFTMTGGTITGCGKSGVNVTGGTFNVSGNPVITGNGTLDDPDALVGNVCLGKDKTINVTGKLDDDVQIGVVTEQKPADTESTVSIITGLDGNGSITNFISDDDYEIRWDSEKKEAVIAVPWTYTAKDNVITATRGSKTATLKLEAEDKTYDGKPISAVLTASDGWDTNTGLPDPSKLAITYRPKNTGDAGEYTASITLSNTTAAIKVTINKAAQTAPETTDFTTASASSKTASDGSIGGVTDTMEYSTDNGETYTKVSGNKITGLKAGDVLIRYAEDKNHSASEAVTLTVNLADKTYAPVVPGITWTKGSSSGAVFQFKGSRDDDETYELFREVQADGKTVAAANYTARPGSVVIEFKPAYLETLAEGTHTVKAVMEDGSAEATLIIKKPSSGGGSSPKKPSTPTDNVVTCQMAGYPANYSWNEAAKACQPGYIDAAGNFRPYRPSDKMVPNTYDSGLAGYAVTFTISIITAFFCGLLLLDEKHRN